MGSENLVVGECRRMDGSVTRDGRVLRKNALETRGSTVQQQHEPKGAKEKGVSKVVVDVV